MYREVRLVVESGGEVSRHFDWMKHEIHVAKLDPFKLLSYYPGKILSNFIALYKHK